MGEPRLARAAVERIWAPLATALAAGARSFGAWLPQVTPKYDWDLPHLVHIREHLDAVTDGEISKLILEVPVRHGKTELVSVRYPVYRIERRPTTRVILGAYNDTYARKISRKARRIATEREQMGALVLSHDRTAVEDWETAAGGGMRAVGVGAGIAGHGADLIIFDDPVKNREEAESPTYRDRVWEWYTDDVYTRLEPGGAVILTMARWHEDDLTGRILNSDDGKNWTVVTLPALAEDDDPLDRSPGEALWPARYDEEALADRKRILGTYGFSALYQQRPAPASGTIIRKEWWKFWRHTPREAGRDGPEYVLLPPVFQQEIQSWDLTFKKAADVDFVVGQDWAMTGAQIFLLDETREKLDFPETLKEFSRFSAKHPNAKLKAVEDKANGPALIATLRNSIPGIVAVPNNDGVLALAHANAAYIEAGNVYLPDYTMPGYEWVHDFIEEWSRYPKGAYDDRVAAGVQAIHLLTKAAPGRAQMQKMLAELQDAKPSEATSVARRRF